MTRKTTDQIAEVEHEIAKAHEARESAQAEYREFIAREDMAAAKHARDAIRRTDDQIEVLTDRLESLEAQRGEQEQATADQKLKQATKRAEEKAEAERQAAAEVGDIAEQMRVLVNRLGAASSESFRATAAMQRAAADAGKDAPIVRTPASREADPRHLLKHGQGICRAFDQQSTSMTNQTSRRRKAG